MAIHRSAATRLGAAMAAAALGIAAGCAAQHEPAIMEWQAPEPSLAVLPQTFEFGGSAAGIHLREAAAEPDFLILEVAATGARGLKAIYFTLHYDAAQLTPLAAEASAELQTAGPLLQLAAMQEPGRLHFGAVVVHPDQAGRGLSGNSALATVRFARQRFDAPRRASIPPRSDAARSELQLDVPTRTFTWRYYSPGDYDQNGEVGIADLTPLGLHFGETASGPAFDPATAQSVVDGDGNGEINLADLTTIGQNFGNNVSSFRVFGGATAGDYPAGNDASDGIAELETVPFSAVQGNAAAERVWFQYHLDPLPAAYYWVRPVDSAGASGTPSTAQDLLAGIPNSPPSASLLADISAGTLPLLVNFTATATDPDLFDSLEYHWDFDGDGSFDLNSGGVNTAAYTFTSSAQFTARVYVSDGTDWSNASTTVTVATPGGNVAPLVILHADPPGGFGPLPVNFTAEVIDPDAGQTYSFQWDFEDDGFFDLDSGPVSAATSTYSYDFVTSGYYTCRVRVSDGFDTAESTATISVNPPDNPPVFDFFNSDVSSGPAPLTVNFSASATDLDGDPVSYLWDFEGNGSWVAGGDVATHTYNPPGTYNAFCRAEDGIEGTTAAPIVITVSP